MERLLFVASEAYPLVKTGGLADIAGSLPQVLGEKGLDVRLLLPAYADVLRDMQQPLEEVASLDVSGYAVRILQCRLPGTAVLTWLIDHPMFAQRSGNPYHDEQGAPWADSAERFMLLSRVAAYISTCDSALGWRPDVLHCNDWHTGPAIALVHQQEQRPRTVFTIHNLAHMGIFDRQTFDQLALPGHLWRELEFYGQFSFMKGGLVFADVITTVSPGYAREICESPGGMGLEGLLTARRERLVGILNGIQGETWNPATDAYLAHSYDVDTLPDKGLNKSALQRELGLQPLAEVPLLGFVGRLVEQKGLELMLPVLDQIMDLPVQLVVLGTGDPRYERELCARAQARPEAMAVMLAYNEGLAHRIEAGTDIFLMPSLFEPCGLNQLYSLRYGTLPVVRAVGGLADTVVDATDASMESGQATGFVFQRPQADDFLQTVRRAVALWYDQSTWRKVQRTAMTRDFSWQRSADQYLELYRSTLE